MQNILEQEHELRAFDVDISGSFIPSAILTRMQEVAEDHAFSAGFGRVELGDNMGLAWVLTRLNLKMNEYPKLGDKIKILTYPAPPTKLYFVRYFAIKDSFGNELGRASSIWVLFDMKKRCLVRPDALGSPYPNDPTLPAIMPVPTKISMPAEMDFICTRRVLYSDTDMNKHMNNAKYANWICELFENDFLQDHKIKNLKINYVSEARIGQYMELYTFVKDEINTIFIRGITEEKTVFDAAVEFFI